MSTTEEARDALAEYARSAPSDYERAYADPLADALRALLAGMEGERARARTKALPTDDGLWEEVLRLRGQIEEARSAWWSATEQGDNGLIYTDRIEDAMDDIWSAIGHVDWTPDHTNGGGRDA